MTFKTDLYKPSNFKIIFDKYYPLMVLYSVNFISSKEICEDIVQEVFLKIWDKEIEFENEKALKTYLYNSVKNTSLNYLKHQAVVNKYNDLAKEDVYEEDFALSNLIKNEVYTLLINALEELPKKCAQIYKLSLNGLKASEIAEDMGLAVETVKSQKKRAKKLLKEKLGRFSYFVFLLFV